MSAHGRVAIGPLEEPDVSAADALFRLAFGTALGLPEPSRFAEGAELVRPRWLASPASALAAHAGGELVGLAMLARWGAHAILGPVAVRPDHWGRGIARSLWDSCLPLLDEWGVSHTALFTRGSPTHFRLYQACGFWPGAPAVVTEKALGAGSGDVTLRTLGGLGGDERRAALDECRRLAEAVEPGLDLTHEILAVEGQRLGDAILVEGGFAVCHAGPGSEAPPGSCHVKFAAVEGGDGAALRLDALLDACEAYAAGLGLGTLGVGVNTARREAYGRLVERGHLPTVVGVAMHRPDGPSYDRPGVYALDDRR